MSHHKRAIDALHFGVNVHADVVCGLHKPNADNLSVFETIYHLYTEDGVQVIGSPENAFATFSPSLGRIYVYARDPKYIDIVSYQSRSILAALNCAQEKGAQFSVSGNDVICTIVNVCARGATYGEAALRALLKYQRWESAAGLVSHECR